MDGLIILFILLGIFLLPLLIFDKLATAVAITTIMLLIVVGIVIASRHKNR